MFASINNRNTLKILFCGIYDHWFVNSTFTCTMTIYYVGRKLNAMEFYFPLCHAIMQADEY